MKIGIIGLGFVGNAILKNNNTHDIITVDIDKKKSNGDYSDLVDAEGVFVCVPSPSLEDGSCDTSIIESVLIELKNVNYNNVIISKVTAPPDFYRKWCSEMPNLVYSPEFLTARNAEEDYKNSSFIVIGGYVGAYVREAKRIIGRTPVFAQVVLCKPEEASMMKYTINSFLATKVSFMNEIQRICTNSGIDYDQVKELVKLDRRIGDSHMDVPGPDGKFGFGGMCFPKDTKALLHYSNDTMPILKTIIQENDKDRGV